MTTDPGGYPPFAPSSARATCSPTRSNTGTNTATRESFWSAAPAASAATRTPTAGAPTMGTMSLLQILEASIVHQEDGLRRFLDSIHRPSNENEQDSLHDDTTATSTTPLLALLCPTLHREDTLSSSRLTEILQEALQQLQDYQNQFAEERSKVGEALNAAADAAAESDANLTAVSTASTTSESLTVANPDLDHRDVPDDKSLRGDEE